MRNMRQTGGSNGLSTAKRGTEIVLTDFTGISYMCKEKGHRAMHCPNKESKGGGSQGWRKPRVEARVEKGRSRATRPRDSMEIPIIAESKGTKRQTV